jgi:ribosome biogenesis protein Nip4
MPESQPAQVRTLDPPEKEAFEALLADYGVALDSDWRRGRELRVVARDDLDPRRRVVLVQNDLLPCLDAVKPQTVGLPVAQLARKGARLTLEGAVWIAESATKRLVFTTQKGETMFLYGRPLLASSVRRVMGDVKAGDEVLVLRASDRRCIGIGIAQQVLVQKGQRESKEVAVTSRLDLGRYLRDAQAVLE